MRINCKNIRVIVSPLPLAAKMLEEDWIIGEMLLKNCNYKYWKTFQGEQSATTLLLLCINSPFHRHSHGEYNNMMPERKLTNIESSFAMEDLPFDEECRDRIKKILKGTLSVQEVIVELNKKYKKK